VVEGRGANRIVMRGLMSESRLKGMDMEFGFGDWVVEEGRSCYICPTRWQGLVHTSQQKRFDEATAN